MATTTKKVNPKFIARLKQVTRPEFVDQLERATSESIEDLMVTIGASAVGIVSVATMDLPVDLITWGIFVIVTVHINLLFIRIARKFDISYTLNELAERVIEMDQEITERLNRILREEGLSTPELERD